MALRDHSRRQEIWAMRERARATLPEAFGNFLASLVTWDWFVNPISFRDDWRKVHPPNRCQGEKTGPPCSDEGMAYIGEFLADLSTAAGGPVGWVIAEEFGRLTGRWHCHLLIHGVAHLNRRFWWKEAFRRFGRTRIEPFDPTRAGAFYAAKYAAKAFGKIHFGGTLAGVELSRVVEVRESERIQTVFPKLFSGTQPCRYSTTVKVKRVWVDLASSSEPAATHAVIAPSADVERTFYRLGLRRWHR